MIKKCGRCNLEKPISEFGKRGKRHDLKSYCRKCDNEYKTQIYLLANPLSKIDDLDGEIWKDISGFSNYYMVSNLGRIKSKQISINEGKILREKLRALNRNKSGYLTCAIGSKNSRKTVSIHRMVAICFLDNPLNRNEVNHKNGIKSDNYTDNLEWCTRSENIKHAFGTGLKSVPSYENSKYTRLTREQVVEIKNLLLNGKSMYKIGKLFSVYRSTIRYIKIGKIWKGI